MQVDGLPLDGKIVDISSVNLRVPY